MESEEGTQAIPGNEKEGTESEEEEVFESYSWI